MQSFRENVEFPDMIPTEETRAFSRCLRSVDAERNRGSMLRSSYSHPVPSFRTAPALSANQGFQGFPGMPQKSFNLLIIMKLLKLPASRRHTPSRHSTVKKRVMETAMERPNMLSATFCRTVRTPGRYGDGSGGFGLSLLVRTAVRGHTTKRWTLSVRIDQRLTSIGLGRYPVVPLSLVRQRALENAQAIAEGRDPRRRAALRRSLRDGDLDPRWELEARRTERGELALDDARLRLPPARGHARRRRGRHGRHGRAAADLDREDGDHRAR